MTEIKWQALHDPIHRALIIALQKHGKSMYGICAKFDPIASETSITGVYKMRHVSEDLAKAVAASLATTETQT
jgi:hypothetical protein